MDNGVGQSCTLLNMTNAYMLLIETIVLQNEHLFVIAIPITRLFTLRCENPLPKNASNEIIFGEYYDICIQIPKFLWMPDNLYEQWSRP